MSEAQFISCCEVTRLLEIIWIEIAGAADKA